MTTRTRRRADAERSISRIVAAARELLGRDPAATIDEIAAAAGVGRMTLYGHFPNRAELVEAALADALADGERTLSAVDLAGDPGDALDRLLASSWSLVAESSSLLVAAQEVLPPGRVRQLHGAPAARLEELIRRGQRDGAFRTDLPIGWLVSAVHYLLKGAAEEVRAGRLDAADVAAVVTASVRALLRPAPAPPR
ncbi:TetR/AcrR family transcriptional regulator [Jiangella sp. DSM 45060]|uniref:TetR/AcrR family transcriptional regulator n=1 Tax=Jiangella sp. DSM 45060 TaxID=1798224 RepID=UPI000879A290|nr:TetR/AcrR family transcriptional regulator [Jiangella sp. DSM 45060]SDS60455.1 DNA-binding transcriptional regulator, AcrR family [Jiangella sp. DSM 45060]